MFSMSDKIHKFANDRYIMLKQRGTRCPFLDKFLSLGIDKGNDELVATEKLFEAYCTAVAFCQCLVTTTQCVPPSRNCSPRLPWKDTKHITSTVYFTFHI